MAIVSHVAIGHQQILMTDAGRVVFFLCTTIDSHAFAKNVFMADFQTGRRPFVSGILRLAANRSAGEEAVAFADGCVARD